MLLTALILGVAGSLHCAGMCSPLALAVSNLNTRAFTNRILYNVGRITTYGILGAITATAGYALPISGFQNLLSLILGVGLILMAMVGITGVRIPIITAALIKFTNLIKTSFSRYIGQRSAGALLLLGSLNGLLPCGLTFIALSFCLTLSSPLEGFLQMFVFGIGTLPVMLGVVSVVDIVKNKLRWNIGKVTTTLMIISGLLLLARVLLMHAPEAHAHGMSASEIVICR